MSELEAFPKPRNERAYTQTDLEEAEDAFNRAINYLNSFDVSDENVDMAAMAQAKKEWETTRGIYLKIKELVKQ